MTGLIQWRNFSVSVGIAIFGAVYIVWAGTYPRDLGTLPGIVGWLTLVLGLIDAVTYTNTTVGMKIRHLVGQADPGEEKDDEPAAPWITLAASIGWPFAYVVTVAYVGFLYATPAYIFFYMWLFGKRSLLFSLFSALIVTGLIWVTFEYLFQYPLFEGLLFGDQF